MLPQKAKKKAAGGAGGIVSDECYWPWKLSL